MTGYKSMQYLRNLCREANAKFTALQDAQETCNPDRIAGHLLSLQITYDSIKAACSMAKICGLLVALSRDGVTGLFAFVTIWDTETDEVFTGWIPRDETETDVNDYDQMKRESYICFATSKHGTFRRVESTGGGVYNAFDGDSLPWVFERRDVLKEV